MNTFSSTSPSVFPDDISLKNHILSWFQGVKKEEVVEVKEWKPVIEEKDFFIESLDDISGIKISGDRILFWYDEHLCNCPMREKEPTDEFVLFDSESCSVKFLKMRTRCMKDRILEGMAQLNI